jgi:hypothetical protein
MYKYFIQSGVRRALASLKDGRKTIPAILHCEGLRSERWLRMPLDRLFTSKTMVARDERFLRIAPPIHTPIEIELLGERGQPASIPLSRVQLK